jgi:hypothetical protein
MVNKSFLKFCELTDKQIESIKYNWEYKYIRALCVREHFAFITLDDGAKIIQNLEIKTDWLLRMPNGSKKRIKNVSFDAAWDLAKDASWKLEVNNE